MRKESNWDGLKQEMLLTSITVLFGEITKVHIFHGTVIHLLLRQHQINKLLYL